MLTKKEKEWLNELKKLARRQPKNIELIVMEDDVKVVKAGDSYNTGLWVTAKNYIDD